MTATPASSALGGILSGRRASAPVSVSLRFLIAAAFGLGALGLAATLVFFEGRLAARQVERDIGLRLEELAFQLSDKLGRSLHERYRHVQWLAASQTIADPNGSQTVQRFALDFTQRGYPEFAWMGLVRAQDSVVQVSTGRILEGADVSGRPWWREALKGPYLGDVHDAIALARLLPHLEGDGLRFLDIGAPLIGRDGRVWGALAAHVSWTWATEIEQSLLRPEQTRQEIELLVLNTEGEVILGPANWRRQRVDLPAVKTAQAGSAVHSIDRWSDGRAYLSGFIPASSYRDTPGLGWVVVARQPLATAMAPVRELQRSILAWGGIVALLFAVGGWFIAAQVVRPLRGLVQAADTMRRGGVIERPPAVDRIREVRSLMESLTSLFSSLREREAELRAAYDSVGAIVEFSPLAIVGLGADRRVATWNQVAEDIFQIDSAAIVGRPLDFHNRAFGQALEPLFEAQAQGLKTRDVEVLYRRADGTERTLLASAAPIGAEGSPVNGMVLTFQDITERKARDEQLRQSQKLETVGQLTGGIAHDFNNLLAVVIGNLDLALMQAEKSGELADLLESALNGATRGAELTKQLLAFSRRQPLQVQSHDVNALVRNATHLLRRTLGEGIRIETRLADDIWLAGVDAAQLESAVVNLAVNARDAMAGTGHLTIETGNKVLDASYAASHREVLPGEYVMIAVTDTGSGMTAEVLARVFEPFFTTKGPGKGTGLGLSMVYGFVKQIGGHIAIYSEVGRGTTVRLYLPRRDGMAEDTASTGDVAEPMGRGELVLVVEDNQMVRATVTAQLSSLGYRTLAAADAGEALVALRAHPDIALLFTDIIMGQGDPGTVLAQHARTLRPDLKIVFTTGFASAGVLAHGFSDGDLLLSKPYRRLDLARMLDRALHAEPSVELAR